MRSPLPRLLRRTTRAGTAVAVAAAVVAGLALGAGTASAATTVRVAEADILMPCSASTPVCEFNRDGGTAAVVDDGRAQTGRGYLRLDTAVANAKATVSTTAFSGRKLSEITTLGYRTLVEQLGTSDARQAPALNISITPVGGGFTTLVWEPVYTPDGTITQGAWQQWSPSSSRGGWWASGTNPVTDQTNVYGFTSFTASFADVQAAQGDAIVQLIGVNQGGGNPGLQAGVDLLTVNETTYDFDNPVVATAIAATDGNGQSAEVGKPFAKPLTATVTGAGGDPVPNAPVTFAVTGGSAAFGTSATASTTTNAAGAAVSPTLTAGATAGPVTVTATSGTFTATYTLTVTPAPVVGPARADVSVAITAPATVRQGGTFTATVTVRNAGPAAATTVASGLTVPKGLRITAGGGGIVARDGRAVAFVAPSIASGSTVTYTVTVAVDRGVRGQQTLAAAGTSLRVADPNLRNNAATARTTAG